MDLWTSVGSFAMVALLVTLTPGIDTALVLRTVIARGRTQALGAGLGIAGGVLVWGVAAALGISALLLASGTAYTVVRIAGAVYMVWLGLGMLRCAFSRRGGVKPDDRSGRVATAGSGSFRQGFLTNLMNPKVGALYVALLPQFIPDGVAPAAMGAGLALVHGVLSLAWFALLIVGVGVMRRWLARPVVQRGVDGVAGAVIVGFGAALALGG